LTVLVARYHGDIVPAGPFNRHDINSLVAISCIAIQSVVALFWAHSILFYASPCHSMLSVPPASLYDPKPKPSPAAMTSGPEPGFGRGFGLFPLALSELLRNACACVRVKAKLCVCLHLTL
jgi:hypothetical protein